MLLALIINIIILVALCVRILNIYLYDIICKYLSFYKYGNITLTNYHQLPFLGSMHIT